MSILPDTTESQSDRSSTEDDSDENEVWLCMNDLDGRGAYMVRFDKSECSDGSCGVLMSNPESMNLNMEEEC